MVVVVEVVEGFGDRVGDAVDGGEEGFGHNDDLEQLHKWVTAKLPGLRLRQ